MPAFPGKGGTFIEYMSEPMGACCFLLGKEPHQAGEMKISGLEQTREKLKRLRSEFQRDIWSKPVAVEPGRHSHFFVENPAYFCYSESFEFGDSEMEATFHFVCGEKTGSQLLLFVQHCPAGEPLQIAHSDHQYVHFRGKPGDVCHHVFTIRTQAHVGYSFIGRVENGGPKPREIYFWLQRKHGGP